LGHDDAAQLLQETLQQEKNTDEILNKMAMQAINQKALEAEQGREEEEGGGRRHHRHPEHHRHAA
jgi:hypothetical protein